MQLAPTTLAQVPVPACHVLLAHIPLAQGLWLSQAAACAALAAMFLWLELPIAPSVALERTSLAQGLAPVLCAFLAGTSLARVPLQQPAAANVQLAPMLP